MNQIMYNNNVFQYYSAAQYPGKSILTNTKINIGDSIYWAKGIGRFFSIRNKLN